LIILADEKELDRFRDSDILLPPNSTHTSSSELDWHYYWSACYARRFKE